MNSLTCVPSPLPEDHQGLIAMLHQLGHFHSIDDDNFVVEERSLGDVLKLSPNDNDVKDAVASWQDMHGVVVDGHFGPYSSLAAYQEVRRCGCPDMMRRPGAKTGWDEKCHGSITTAHALDSLKFTGGRSIDEAWQWGLDQWNNACGIHLLVIESMSAARISATPDSMSRGVLAMAQLPQGSCSARLKQWYNRAVNWNFQLKSRTDMHELGHSIGLGHIGRRIMTPMLQSDLTEDNAIDEPVRVRIVKIYGPPKEPPLPPEPPDVPPGSFHHGIVSGLDVNGNPIGDWEIKPRVKPKLANDGDVS